MFKEIIQPFNYTFSVSQKGLYAISVSASCKYGKLLGLFGGEDLRVEIDDIKLREAPAKDKPQYKDIPSTWNGTELKGLSKTVVFILWLEQSEHTIKFIPDYGAIIEKEPEIVLLDENKKEIELLTDLQAQDGNCRPWITIALIDLSLNILDVLVKCEKRFLDSDDVKIIIDGQIQKNKQASWRAKWAKNWYWQGRFLKGRTEEVRFYPQLTKGIHYIEFWADRMPVLNWVKINLGEAEEKKIIQKYTYRGVNGNEDYNRFDEKIKNIVKYWNDVFLKQEYPPEKLLDPNLVKAVTFRESRIGYERGGEIDVMQVGDPDNPALFSLKNIAGYSANEFVSKNKKDHLSYNFPKERLPVKIESPEESIFWGVRWLYNKAQIYYGTGENNLKPPFIREWKTWEQAVIDYNGSKYKHEYQKKVWQIYKDGIDPDGNILWNKNLNGFSLIKILSIIGIISVIFLAGWFWSAKLCDDFYSQKEYEEYKINKEKHKQEEISFSSQEADEATIHVFIQDLEEYKKDKNYYGDVFQKTAEICEKVRCYMEWVVINYYDDLVDNMKSNEQFLKATRAFDFMKNTQTGERNIQTGDIDNDGENEIVFIRHDVLNQEYIVIMIIDKIDGKFKIIEKKLDEGYDGYVKLLDVTNDLQPEILLFMSQGRGGYPLYVYQYLENKTLQEMFKSEFSLFPDYTFSDLDNDGLIEIKMQGELKDAIKDYHVEVQKIYEYNKEKNNFVKIKDIQRELN